MSKILLIDDDADFRLLFERKFTDLGHEVFTAADGVRGLQIVMDTPVDLILLDLNMPHRGGVETLRFIRSVNPNVPVIILTGLMDEAAQAQIKDWSVKNIIYKPIRIRELATTVEKALGIAHA
jgi:two-component system, NtrC family, nitrogen regulation response regulator NtrX